MCFFVVVKYFRKKNKEFKTVLITSFILLLTTTYKSITSTEHFNMNPEKNKLLDYFNETFNLKNLINEPTCFKSQNPSVLDLTLSNHRSSFMKTVVLEIGTSDHHKMISSILKHNSAKGQSKIIC